MLFSRRWRFMTNPLTKSGLYPTVEDVLSDAGARLAADDVSSALQLVQRFVKAVNTDPRSIARVFADHALDDFCRTLGAGVLARFSAHRAAGNADASPEGTVYLATELYKTGGHTAVLEDLLKTGSFAGRSTILLTNVLGTANLEAIGQRFAAYGIDIECAPEGTLEARLIWALERLRALRPKNLLLFNHHEDSVAIAAAQPSLAERTIFYHHADHHLCLGVTLTYDLHADPSPMGYHNCRDHLGVDAAVYWPLTVEDRGDPGPHRRSLTAGGKLRTCSAGTRNKFEQPYRFQYADLIPKMLAATQGSHVHIGLLSESTLARIAEGMRREGIAADRLIYIEWVPSLWHALQEQAVDVYIGSFPVTGSRSLVEALGSGTPAIAHKSYMSCFHGGADMLYPQAFAWEAFDDLLSHLATLDVSALGQEARWARARFEQVHMLDALRRTIMLGQDAHPAPPLRPLYSDPLQTLLDDIGISAREIDRLERDREQLTAKNAELAADAHALRGALGDIHASRAWRMACAIRGLAQKVRSAGLPL
ncbi:hypothetical protein BZM27_05350 [Paraburkholderia steynii]|uniref:Glycosyltransferase n=1 Tax=Paraburkholderia steynii TaxID=1245441 RepID=A0A4R0XPX6_9BURK|nr:hypothetical protein BZM27_05350 [Paraburkholderia steynii]